MEALFKMIDKRKSFRKFNSDLLVSHQELDLIKLTLNNIKSLNPNIKTDFKIVKATETTAKFGEYCLLFYSEKRPHQLVNAGFILEKIDLYMASLNIGACWYGLARTKEKTYHGLDYIIMLAFGKVDRNEFRHSIKEFNRKSIIELWDGEFNPQIQAFSLLAPSACNSQPWRFKSTNSTIEVYRKQSIRTIMPLGIRSHYNMIDMGIVLSFLDILLSHYAYSYQIDLPAEFLTDEDNVFVASIKIIHEGEENGNK